MSTQDNLTAPRGLTCRQISQRLTAIFGASAALPLFSEFALAQQAEREFTGSARAAADE